MKLARIQCVAAVILAATSAACATDKPNASRPVPGNPAARSTPHVTPLSVQPVQAPRPALKYRLLPGSSGADTGQRRADLPAGLSPDGPEERGAKEVD